MSKWGWLCLEALRGSERPSVLLQDVVAAACVPPILPSSFLFALLPSIQESVLMKMLWPF